MLCAKCGADNPTDARFCGKCGHALKTDPPVRPVSPADEPTAREPRQKQNWLTGPVILAGVAVIILGIVGLVALVYLVGAHKSQPSSTEENSSSMSQTFDTAPAMPATEDVVPPSKSDSYNNALNTPANAPPPGKFTAVSDTLYRQKAVGTWRVRRFLDNGVYMDMQAAYLPNGMANWGGTVTAQGQTIYIAMTGSWEIKGGYFTVRVTASNIPQLIPSGYTSVNRIVTLTDDEWTYVDSLNGGSETAVRVR